MRTKIYILFLFLTVFCTAVYTQTHSSVSIDNQIYYLLEQAQLRGLCSPLPGTRPYTHNIVISTIREIFASEKSYKLSDAEWEILENYLYKFSKPKIGFDFIRGGYYNEAKIGKKEFLLSGNIGLFLDAEASGGFYNSFKENYYGTDFWLGLYVNGDISSYVSYNFIIMGGIFQAPRKDLGEYYPYYDGFIGDGEYINDPINAYSEPLHTFPYSYRKKWDGSVYSFSSLQDYKYWPQSISAGYSIFPELTASFWEDRIIITAGRILRDWGSTPQGTSLFFNQSARPFYAFEIAFRPVSWFNFASLAGILEYLNKEGIKASASTFQNAFSINMFQFRFRNYLFFDFADIVVYPKRFEPGYMIPIVFNFFYQNNIGDFDNMMMSFSLKAQYPGIGFIWGSFFLDEINFLHNISTLDRQMFSWQTGAAFFLPFLSFSSIKFSYTKVNPYCYTHPRNFNPWYSDRMETSYTSNGVGLGYYLPPNSDEFLIRFETMPVKSLSVNLQYQLIRHGADFGSNAVDGSNLLSELAYIVNLEEEPALKKYFLKDGAYQWFHSIKLGGEWYPNKMPFSFNWEIGVVISYFTNIEGKANSGSPGSYSIVDTAEYPRSTGFIGKLGFKIYPRY